MLLFPSELFDVICDRDFGPDKDLHPFLHLKHLVMKPFIPACVEILEQQVRELESSKSNWEPMPSTTFIELTSPICGMKSCLRLTRFVPHILEIRVKVGKRCLYRLDQWK
jgi:hypothetical protein